MSFLPHDFEATLVRHNELLTQTQRTYNGLWPIVPASAVSTVPEREPVMQTTGRVQHLASGELALHVAAVMLVAGIALLSGSNGWDEGIAAYFFDVARAGFPLRDTWVMKTLLHDGGKELPVLTALALLGARVHGHSPHSRWHASRHDLAYALAVLLVSAGIAGLLKGATPMQCPWSITGFGGSQPHHSLTDWLHGLVPAGAHPGHCWPSGHAAGAFGLAGLYFIARQRGHAAALPWLAAVLGWGLLSGWVQVARGAHFVSHVLWSAVLCWTTALAMLPVLVRAGRTATPCENDILSPLSQQS